MRPLAIAATIVGTLAALWLASGLGGGPVDLTEPPRLASLAFVAVCGGTLLFVLLTARPMRTFGIVAAILALLGVIGLGLGAIWGSVSRLQLAGAGILPIVLTILGCLAVGGGLMFLVFFSARKGYDEQVGVTRLEDEGERRPNWTDRTPP